MGIPYSKEINHAFDQVTPLVAEGSQVLEKTKNIAVVLLWLEIASALIIALNLVCLLALLVTLNPDLEEERRTLVTPVVRWVAGSAAQAAGVLGRWWVVVVLGVLGVYGVGVWMWVRHGGSGVEGVEGDDGAGEEEPDGGEKDKKGKGKGKKGKDDEQKKDAGDE
ncbi:hypothetical protein Micbo1qcDRAFT_178651 [Microdochium bolleyi]|uniref:Uncharacterized protein n=1 Tax=Microdochium bolleyi TaxID=196109 RepID=A0A136ISW1_9PEZI|nr:hypothetical protein Micbo1qcDRAFT_178651 [Microdochium bolleyi]